MRYVHEGRVVTIHAAIPVGTPILLDIFVPGRPKPGGSKTAFRLANGHVVVTDASGAAGKQWRQDVRSAAYQAWQAEGRELLAEPVTLWATFYRQRAQSHFGSGRNAGVLKADAPLYPTGAPDSLKLGRAVEDALTGVIWVDDRYVVDTHARKRYGDPGVRIVVSRMTARADEYESPLFEPVGCKEIEP